jgi:hypothetical protein
MEKMILIIIFYQLKNYQKQESFRSNKKELGKSMWYDIFIKLNYNKFIDKN